ncbi:MAG TPA: class I SAM-dependent methyltransferase [Bryobacteraceae bacterium]|nr:class I SAM-dependent methyltransferase [Bryobacteraceae bacterium]
MASVLPTTRPDRSHVPVPSPWRRWFKGWEEIWAAPLNDLPLGHELIYRHLQLDSSMDILEIGPGSGYAAFVLSRYVRTVTLLDIATATIAKLESSLHARDNLRFVEGNICEKPASSHFDAAFGLEMFQYVPDSASALANLRESLRPGGQLLLQWPNYSPERSTGPNSIRFRSELDAMMASAGFSEWSVFALRLRPYAAMLYEKLHESPLAVFRRMRRAQKPIQSNFDQSWSARSGTNTPMKIVLHSAWKLLMGGIHWGGDPFILQPAQEHLLGNNLLLLARR